MKTKFEANVAQELPKTRMSQEPGLPWKLDPEDIEKASEGSEVYKAASSGTPPLKTRPVFIVLLLTAIFVAVMNFVSLVIVDNENARASSRKKEITMSSLKMALEKINAQKNTLSDNIGQLEKRVNDLSAQKELFATVIESLTKKGDEPTSDEKAALQQVQSAHEAAQAAAAEQGASAAPEAKSVQ